MRWRFGAKTTSLFMAKRMFAASKWKPPNEKPPHEDRFGRLRIVGRTLGDRRVAHLEIGRLELPIHRGNAVQEGS